MTLYFEVELSRDKRPGTEQNTSPVLTDMPPKKPSLFIIREVTDLGGTGTGEREKKICHKGDRVSMLATADRMNVSLPAQGRGHRPGAKRKAAAGSVCSHGSAVRSERCVQTKCKSHHLWKLTPSVWTCESGLPQSHSLHKSGKARNPEFGLCCEARQIHRVLAV